jgi:wyosine [tRNA(Phe)-imidazoG37] synthetase (radical SAM superfamily)
MKTSNLWSLDCQPVYGPIPSRRYGFSLGINLLPAGTKVCNFDCLYCQCGCTCRSKVTDSFSGIFFRPIEELRQELASHFKRLSSETVIPETIVFSGNGEPTLYPNFSEAVNLVKQYRDSYFREARIGILTNGTQVLQRPVFEAVAGMDFKSVKLDAGVEWLDRPISNYDLEAFIPIWREIPNLTIQSFFCEGHFDNTRPEMVKPWIKQIHRLRPRRVHIYTLDRTPAAKRIQKASLTCLTRVARQLVNETGIQVEVFD